MLSRPHRPSPALIISIVALVVALTGTATAVKTKIKSSQIAKNAVTSPKIRDGGVQTGDLGLNAVTSDRIADGQVSAGDLANQAATTGKIGDLAVTTGKIGDQAVTTGKLNANAVTATQIANGSVTGPKLAGISFNQSADIAVPTGESRSATATCPAGQVVISGGAHFDGAGNTDNNMGMLHSYRLSNTQWLSRVFNNSGVSQTFQAYAFCLAA